MLVHVTASPDWSTLALSGLFPEMLHRLVILSSGQAGAEAGDFGRKLESSEDGAKLDAGARGGYIFNAGIKGIDSSRGVTFDNALVAYQAAMDGLGVALGRAPLVAPDLKAGRLVMPFDYKMSSEFAYYLVYPAEAIRRRGDRKLEGR